MSSWQTEEEKEKEEEERRNRQEIEDSFNRLWLASIKKIRKIISKDLHRHAERKQTRFTLWQIQKIQEKTDKAESDIITLGDSDSLNQVFKVLAKRFKNNKKFLKRVGINFLKVRKEKTGEDESAAARDLGVVPGDEGEGLQDPAHPNDGPA